MSDNIIREKSTIFGSIRHNNLNSKIIIIIYIYISTYNFYSDENSPLKLFTHAKITITNIFKHILTYVHDSNIYLNGLFILFIQ